MRRSVVICSAVVLLALLFLAGACGRNQQSSDGSGEKNSITIKGSDTMVQLASAWAEVYMEKHPEIHVSVTGGGSGTGISALINGTTDIAIASRSMKDKERTKLADKGTEAKEIDVALDGIAVIVSLENPVKELTIEQMSNIFTGKTQNWKELRGEDRSITILSRESSSGTFVFFQEMVLNKQDYSVNALLMPATNTIVEEIASNRSAIGYVGIGHAMHAKDKVKIINVKETDSSEAIEPTNESVINGVYPIARPLFFYSAGELRGASKDFVEFCLSDEGQKIVEESGLVPLK